MIQIPQRSLSNNGLASNDDAAALDGAPGQDADASQVDALIDSAGGGDADLLTRFRALFGTPQLPGNVYGDKSTAGNAYVGNGQNGGQNAGPVLYAGGNSALPRLNIGPAVSIAKAAGLDLTRYTSAQLTKLDVVRDGKLDANEANGILRFADADDDGRVSKKEQLALDHVLGKDESIEAMEPFVDLHRGRITNRAANLTREVTSSEQQYIKKDEAHFKRVDEVRRQEDAMRASMNAEGFTWTEETPAQIKEQMTQLTKSGQGDSRKMEELEWRLQYSEMRKTNATDLQTSYNAKETALKVRDDARVENNAFQALTGEATQRIDRATAEVVRFRSSERIADLVELRTAVEADPKVRDAFVKYAKGVAIQNAVRDGKLDGDAVDQAKVKQDLKASLKIIDAHTRKLENAAEQAVKLLQDPTFRDKLAVLPEDERTQILTDLHSLVADTEAGYRLFKQDIWPGLQGKHPKNPEVYDDLKVTRHSSKLALNLTGVWGAQIAKEGGKGALRLMDTQIARAIGVRPDLMPKVYDAMAVANTKGEKAAREMLAAEPELKGIARNFNQVAGGIAVASGILAAHDLIKDPKLRTALGAAKGASEIAEVLARTKVPASIARYATFAGRVGPALDAIIGAYDGYNAVKRNDVAGAIGGFTQSAGGIAGTAGVIAAAAGATGVGLPLAVVGGAIAVLGSLVTALWGDSPSEQWLKDNAPEYIKQD